jgi:hypothetical protein
MFCPECKTAHRKQIAVCATWIFLSPLLFLSSCFLVPSVHPLYTEADIVFDPALLGVWTADDSKDTLTFIEEGANSYKLIVAGDDGPKGEFIVHLVKIGGARFLDLFPDDPACKLNDLHALHLLPVHSFMLVSQIEPTLQLASFDFEWFEKFIEKNPKAIRHEKVKEGFLLTASTRDLQKFLLAHVKTEGAFGEADELKRLAGGQQ